MKWKGHDENENEWVREDNFGTVDIIDKYSKYIHRKNQSETT
jgi:hypothetical protein